MRKITSKDYDRKRMMSKIKSKSRTLLRSQSPSLTPHPALTLLHTLTRSRTLALLLAAEHRTAGEAQGERVFWSGAKRNFSNWPGFNTQRRARYLLASDWVFK